HEQLKTAHSHRQPPRVRSVEAVTVADLYEPDREERDERQQIRDEPRSCEIEKLESPRADENSSVQRLGGCSISRKSHAVLPVMGLGALGAPMGAWGRMLRWRGDEQLWRKMAAAPAAPGRKPMGLQWNRLTATSSTTPVATAASTALLSTRTQ